jgi:hypothetical protein
MGRKPPLHWGSDTLIPSVGYSSETISGSKPLIQSRFGPQQTEDISWTFLRWREQYIRLDKVLMFASLVE